MMILCSKVRGLTPARGVLFLLPAGFSGECAVPNPGLRFPVPATCCILCNNVRSLSMNLSDLTVASYQYDILFCSETLVSVLCHVSVAVFCCVWTEFLDLEGWPLM